MSDRPAFCFGSSTVANAYDDALVPVLFRPWARTLLARHPGLDGRRVLDLATGTGAVAELAAAEVGSEGSVVGVDLNAEMLSLARERCADLDTVSFVQSPAESLDLDDASVDAAFCQQGFQFFPDRGAVAKEIHRVLREDGRALLSTWRPVAESELFNAVCVALEAMGELSVAESMRVPFDHLAADQFAEYFVAAGFEGVEVKAERLPLALDGGVEAGVELAFSTGIRPQLVALPDERQDEFRTTLRHLLEAADLEEGTVGALTANVLTAVK